MKVYSLGTIAVLSLQMILGNAGAAVFDWESTREADHIMALRCYLPDALVQARAIIVLVPGMNGDGRSQANDAEWMGLAQRNGCALIGCCIKGGQGGIYHEVIHWSGDLFLKGVGEIAHMSNHPELDTVPLGFWGISAGGQWNYNFACWKSDRTFAFVANKGAHYHGIPTPALRKVPALWIAGGKDTEERIGNITSLYAENRRKGAPWGLMIEPGGNHAVGRSKEIGMAFLEEALALRVEETGQLHPVEAGAGWLGSFQGFEVAKNTSTDFGTATNTWLPGKNTAELWKCISLGIPSVGTENQDLPNPRHSTQKP